MLLSFSILPSDEEITHALTWSQLGEVFPVLSAAIKKAQAYNVLEENVRTFLSVIGKSATKPSVAVLTKGLPIQLATDLSNQTSAYVRAAWAPSYDYLQHSIFQENYTRGTTSENIKDLVTNAQFGTHQRL